MAWKMMGKPTRKGWKRMELEYEDAAGRSETHTNHPITIQILWQVNHFNHFDRRFRTK
jgi:hypothetical protein